MRQVPGAVDAKVLGFDMAATTMRFGARFTRNKNRSGCCVPRNFAGFPRLGRRGPVAGGGAGDTGGAGIGATGGTNGTTDSDMAIVVIAAKMPHLPAMQRSSNDQAPSMLGRFLRRHRFGRIAIAAGAGVPAGVSAASAPTPA
jgi:hypothetical protein